MYSITAYLLIMTSVNVRLTNTEHKLVMILSQSPYFAGKSQKHDVI